MKTISFIAVAIAAAATIAAPAYAQQASTASAAAPAASMPVDCAKSSMKKHDHGAERNMGSTAAAKPCAPAEAASNAPATSKKVPAHDHAKFHKNQ